LEWKDKEGQKPEDYGEIPRITSDEMNPMDGPSTEKKGYYLARIPPEKEENQWLS
jgi:hypothetical protein